MPHVEQPSRLDSQTRRLQRGALSMPKCIIEGEVNDVGYDGSDHLDAVGRSDLQEMPWLDQYHLPGGTLEGGIELANRLEWNMAWGEGNDGWWYVWGGEKTVLKTNSREAAEAFLYGIGLAYGVLPEGIFDRLEELVRRWL